ncbi:MAG TPA: DUF1931 family protein [Pseudonocardiaceae bacterium]|nr:DUF1931 family protein [Pseudonocardiaceae bacterium]
MHRHSSHRCPSSLRSYTVDLTVPRRPPADVTFSEETEQLLPELFGGLSITLARLFRVIDPKLTNPSTEHWERAFEVFRLVL